MIDIFDEIEKVSGSTEATVVTIAPKFSDEAVYIPHSYQIFSTHDNSSTGKRDIVDTYMCDRAKGIVPNEKAKKKADLMKLAIKTKTYFVEAEYTVIDKGVTVKHLEIIHQTK